MKPAPVFRTETPPETGCGIRRKRMYLAAVATSIAALAAACLPLLFAVPIAALTTVVAAAVGIGSGLIATNHG